MKSKITSLSVTLLGVLLFSSCKVDMPFYTTPENSFVYITDGNNLSKSEVWALAEGLTTDYYIKLSSGTRQSNLTVNFEIVPGDGLREGVDYSVVSPSGSSVVFTTGLYDRVIRIKWLSNSIDPSKDNTLTLRLTERSDNSVGLGLPGPAGNNVQYVITKIE